MAGHVNLRYHRDITLPGILHDLLYFLLGEKSAIAGIVIETCVAPHHGALPVSPHLGEFGPFLDFNPPSLVIGEVEMKHVDVVQGKHVDVLFDEIHAEEVAAHVEVHAPVREARRIRHRHGRNLLGHAVGCQQRFPQCLHTVEDALGLLSLYHHLLLCHSDAVTFRFRHLRIQTQRDATGFHLLVGQFHGLAHHPQVLGQEIRILPHHLAFIVADDLQVLHQKRLAFLRHTFLRQRHDIEISLPLSGEQTWNSH